MEAGLMSMDTSGELIDTYQKVPLFRTAKVGGGRRRIPDTRILRRALRIMTQDMYIRTLLDTPTLSCLCALCM